MACANSNLTPIELVRHLPPKKVLLKRCSKHCTAEKWNLIIKSKWRCRDQKSLVWNWYIKEAQVLICSVSPDLVLRCCTHGLFSQYLLLSPRAWKCWGFKRNLVFGLLPFWFSSLCTSGTALSNLAAVLRNGVPISSFLSTAGPQTPKPKLQTWFTCCFLLKSVLIYGFNQATVSQPHSVSLSINTVLARKKKRNEMTVLNDFITLNWRMSSANTGAARDSFLLSSSKLIETMQEAGLWSVHKERDVLSVIKANP